VLGHARGAWNIGSAEDLKQGHVACISTVEGLWGNAMLGR